MRGTVCRTDCDTHWVAMSSEMGTSSRDRPWRVQ